MKLPKRPDTHISESESWVLLQRLAPPKWIVREVSERDYGVDCYIEIVTDDDEVTGDMMSVQLKATSEIDWKPFDSGGKVARSPSIRSSTANYWLNSPVPTFLFLADLGKEDIYFMGVEDKIRSQFEKLEKQDSISLQLSDQFSLKSPAAAQILRWMYVNERLHERFAFHITKLIGQLDTYANFIREYQNRDVFMEVDADVHLQFRDLYQTCQMASLCLSRDWPVESLTDLYHKDRQQWNDDYVYLHEGTLDYALQQIDKEFLPLLHSALGHVVNTHGSYWRDRDPIFFDLCRNDALKWSMKSLEQEAALSIR